jgi:RNA polymerase sigma-70 factor (ECF subfamily)
LEIIPSMTDSEPDLETLLARATRDDADAIAHLMDRFRNRIRRLIEVRLDPSIRTRVDPSDVVQETLYDAARRLPQYLRDRPVPFYPWLRRLAIQRLVDAHRTHRAADRRSVRHEAHGMLDLPDESQVHLAQRLLASGTSASRQLVNLERRQRVREALLELPDREREVLVLRYLEDLDPPEIAEVLGISERTVWRRHRQALERLSDQLSDGLSR